MKRQARSAAPPTGSTRIAAFTAAPASEAQANTSRGSNRSASDSTALSSVPSTNPACTEEVSQDWKPGSASGAARSRPGAAAVPENHSDSASTCASVISSRFAGLPRRVMTGDGPIRGASWQRAAERA